MRRTWKAPVGLALVAVLTGCQRGCLSTWLSERGFGPASPGAQASSGAFSLQAVDCPDGLARCVDRVVEVSRAYQYPIPCHGTPDECRCPWDRLATCPSGCAADDAEIDVPRERAVAQLCAPAPDASRAAFARPLASGAGAPACEGAFACLGGTVVRCTTPPVGIATCVKGCAREGQALDDDRASSDGATAILCER